MSCTISRRTFLKRGGVAAVVLTGVAPGVAEAACPINFYMHGFDEARFGEETLLRRAMGFVAARLQDPAVWRNVYTVRPSLPYLKHDTLVRANLAQSRQHEKGQMFWQLRALTLTGLFPVVHLHAFHEESNVLGFARRDDAVVVRCVGVDTANTCNRVSVKGDFQIHLNRYQLKSGGLMDDPEQWASTIAHEMMHNLGHLHLPGDYTDMWQINVLNNAVLCRGHYRDSRFRFRSAHMVCGGQR